ncbi:Ribosomal large subunit pseudouridine synthase A [bioreactor metagenome]|uniref:Ribosomal large subunit pseudouridine synthase A n=1 Tax=bioreactor metagenome TaxID=1076179 RepID=A0A645DEX9_9ZZZZ
MHKTYEAVVQGRPDQPDADWHEIDAPILLDWDRRPIHIIDAKGKPSQTQWKLLESPSLPLPSECPAGMTTSRLSLRPITGRTHQLRVHLLHMGWPILGDALYAPDAARNAAPRLLLHASELRFPHPVTRIELLIKSAVPF